MKRLSGGIRKNNQSVLVKYPKKRGKTTMVENKYLSFIIYIPKYFLDSRISFRLYSIKLFFDERFFC